MAWPYSGILTSLTSCGGLSERMDVGEFTSQWPRHIGNVSWDSISNAKFNFCIHWGTKKWLHINPSVEWHASSFKWFTHVDFNCNNQSWECRPGICVIMTLYLQQKNPLYNIFKTRVSATVSLSFVSSSLLLCSVSLQSCHSPWSLPSLAVLLGSPDAHLLCFTL